MGLLCDNFHFLDVKTKKFISFEFMIFISIRIIKN
jgi:hypothetical protein